MLHGSCRCRQWAPMGAKSVTSAPPVYSLSRILHSGDRRACSPLRRQPFTQPSAFRHHCYNTLRPLGMGINHIHFPSIALLISPDALYIYLGWGSPSGPPSVFINFETDTSIVLLSDTHLEVPSSFAPNSQ